MRLGDPEPGDIVFRHIIYPLAHSGKARVFASQKIIRFKETNGVQRTSLAWRRFLPAIEDVHRYGCDIAAAINKNKTVRGILPSKSRHMYVGAYALDPGQLAQKLRASPSVKSVSITHDIENELVAHVDLSVELEGGAGIEGTITELVDRIWAASQGPLRHACSCDADIESHPSDGLGQAPLGDYLDKSSEFGKMLRRIRCRVLTFLWRAFCPAGKSNVQVTSQQGMTV